MININFELEQREESRQNSLNREQIDDSVCALKDCLIEIIFTTNYSRITKVILSMICLDFNEAKINFT